MLNLSTPQPAPIATDETPIVDMVIQDFKDRKAFGLAKHGVPVTAGNGRVQLIDAYQELMDMAIYLRAEIERREQAPVTAQAVIDFLREEARKECYTEAALPFLTVKDMMFMIADRIERNHSAPVQGGAPELAPNAKVVEQTQERQLNNLADYLGGQISSAPKLTPKTVLIKDLRERNLHNLADYMEGLTPEPEDVELDDLRRYQEYVTFCQTSAVEPQSFGDFLSFGRMA